MELTEKIYVHKPDRRYGSHCERRQLQAELYSSNKQEPPELDRHQIRRHPRMSGVLAHREQFTETRSVVVSNLCEKRQEVGRRNCWSLPETCQEPTLIGLCKVQTQGNRKYEPRKLMASGLAHANRKIEYLMKNTAIRKDPKMKGQHIYV